MKTFLSPPALGFLFGIIFLSFFYWIRQEMPLIVFLIGAFIPMLLGWVIVYINNKK